MGVMGRECQLCGQERLTLRTCRRDRSNVKQIVKEFQNNLSGLLGPTRELRARAPPEKDGAEGSALPRSGAAGVHLGHRCFRARVNRYVDAAGGYFDDGCCVAT